MYFYTYKMWLFGRNKDYKQNTVLSFFSERYLQRLILISMLGTFEFVGKMLDPSILKFSDNEELI